jgi:hypothetical protein
MNDGSLSGNGGDQSAPHYLAIEMPSRMSEHRENDGEAEEKG